MVSSSPLPTLAQAVDEVEGRVSGSGAPLVVVTGEPASGKSTLLSRVAERLRAKRRPVLELGVLSAVHGPSGEERYRLADDAGPLLFTTAATQLARLEARDPLRLIEQGAAWDAIAGGLQQAIAATGAVVLLDDAVSRSEEPWFEEYFAQRTREAVELLSRDGAPRVLVTSDEVAVTAGRAVRLSASRCADTVLAPARWNGLGASAAALRDEVDDVELQRLNPLELRLGVALVSAGASPRDAVRLRVREMADALFERLGEQGRELRAVIGRLALERLSLGRDVLGLAGADHLDERARSLLSHAILADECGRLRLHETFARRAAFDGWLSLRARTEMHRALAERHRREFVQATEVGEVGRALRHEMEAFHHYVQAGDTGFLVGGQVRALFTEQLDAFGRALSLATRRVEAASVYQRAVERDEGDWYAHHYLAFNLDWEGRQANLVEAHYRRARELHEQHVWHHGRLACFYVTRGRMERAREAWARALEVLEDGARENERLYHELHRPFARLLLHRGELALAREVLDGVPPRLREGLPWWGALDALHASLTDAERDQSVFSPSVTVDLRWNGPHLVPPSQRAEVRGWMPGRVASVDERAVTIRVAVEPDRLAWYDRPLSEVLASWKGSRTTLTSGTYVEIVSWDWGEEILVHPPVQLNAALPRPLPPPDRYLRGRLRDGTA